jgi:hypothetical protein
MELHSSYTHLVKTKTNETKHHWHAVTNFYTYVKFKNSNKSLIGITKAHKSADSLQNIS